jgi:hypothetical protein
MRRIDTAAGTGDMVRRAARWHAPRPSDEGLRELAELLLRAARDEALLARVVHELGAWSRFATAATATNNMVRGHNDRAAGGGRRLPPLAGKALDFQRCWSHRAPWAWLACR